MLYNGYSASSPIFLNDKLVRNVKQSGQKKTTKPMKYEQISECFISVTLIIEIVEKKEWVILV